MTQGLNKDQILVAIAVRKLLTLGDLPDNDWKLLYSQDKSGLPFAAFKAKMLEELPAYLHFLLHELEPPATSDFRKN